MCCASVCKMAVSYSIHLLCALKGWFSNVWIGRLALDLITRSLHTRCTKTKPTETEAGLPEYRTWEPKLRLALIAKSMLQCHILTESGLFQAQVHRFKIAFLQVKHHEAYKSSQAKKGARCNRGKQCHFFPELYNTGLSPGNHFRDRGLKVKNPAHVTLRTETP
jgi:hypothetical protein